MNCEGNCTGGGNSVGPGACNSCAIVILDSHDNVTSCLPADSNCEDGYFKKTLQGQHIKELNGKQVGIGQIFIDGCPIFNYIIPYWLYYIVQV